MKLYRMVILIVLVFGVMFARDGKPSSQQVREINKDRYFNHSIDYDDRDLDRKRSHKRRRKIRRPIRGLR